MRRNKWPLNQWEASDFWPLLKYSWSFQGENLSLQFFRILFRNSNNFPPFFTLSTKIRPKDKRWLFVSVKIEINDFFRPTDDSLFPIFAKDPFSKNFSRVFSLFKNLQNFLGLPLVAKFVIKRNVKGQKIRFCALECDHLLLLSHQNWFSYWREKRA